MIKGSNRRNKEVCKILGLGRLDYYFSANFTQEDCEIYNIDLSKINQLTDFVSFFDYTEIKAKIRISENKLFDMFNFLNKSSKNKILIDFLPITPLCIPSSLLVLNEKLISDLEENSIFLVESNQNDSEEFKLRVNIDNLVIRELIHNNETEKRENFDLINFQYDYEICDYLFINLNDFTTGEFNLVSIHDFLMRKIFENGDVKIKIVLIFLDYELIQENEIQVLNELILMSDFVFFDKKSAFRLCEVLGYKTDENNFYQRFSLLKEFRRSKFKTKRNFVFFNDFHSLTYIAQDVQTSSIFENYEYYFNLGLKLSYFKAISNNYNNIKFSFLGSLIGRIIRKESFENAFNNSISTLKKILDLYDNKTNIYNPPESLDYFIPDSETKNNRKKEKGEGKSMIPFKIASRKIMIEQKNQNPLSNSVKTRTFLGQKNRSLQPIDYIITAQKKYLEILEENQNLHQKLKMFFNLAPENKDLGQGQGMNQSPSVTKQLKPIKPKENNNNIVFNSKPESELNLKSSLEEKPQQKNKTFNYESVEILNKTKKSFEFKDYKYFDQKFQSNKFREVMNENAIQSINIIRKSNVVNKEKKHESEEICEDYIIKKVEGIIVRAEGFRLKPSVLHKITENAEKSKKEIPIETITVPKLEIGAKQSSIEEKSARKSDLSDWRDGDYGDSKDKSEPKLNEKEIDNINPNDDTQQALLMIEKDLKSSLMDEERSNDKLKPEDHEGDDIEKNFRIDTDEKKDEDIEVDVLNKNNKIQKESSPKIMGDKVETNRKESNNEFIKKDDLVDEKIHQLEKDINNQTRENNENKLESSDNNYKVIDSFNQIEQQNQKIKENNYEKLREENKDKNLIVKVDDNKDKRIEVVDDNQDNQIENNYEDQDIQIEKAYKNQVNQIGKDNVNQAEDNEVEKIDDNQENQVEKNDDNQDNEIEKVEENQDNKIEKVEENQDNKIEKVEENQGIEIEKVEENQDNHVEKENENQDNEIEKVKENKGNQVGKNHDHDNQVEKVDDNQDNQVEENQVVNVHENTKYEVDIVQDKNSNHAYEKIVQVQGYSERKIEENQDISKGINYNQQVIQRNDNQREILRSDEDKTSPKNGEKKLIEEVNNQIQDFNDEKLNNLANE